MFYLYIYICIICRYLSLYNVEW